MALENQMQLARLHFLFMGTLKEVENFMMEASDYYEIKNNEKKRNANETVKEKANKIFHNRAH